MDLKFVGPRHLTNSSTKKYLLKYAPASLSITRAKLFFQHKSSSALPEKPVFSGRGLISQTHFSGHFFRARRERSGGRYNNSEKFSCEETIPIVLLSVVNSMNSDQTNYLNTYGIFHSIFSDCWQKKLFAFLLKLHHPLFLRNCL